MKTSGEVREWLKHLLLGHTVDLEWDVWVSTGSSHKARAGRGRAHLVLLGPEQSLPPGRPPAPLAGLPRKLAVPLSKRRELYPALWDSAVLPRCGRVSSGFWDPVLPADT